MPRRLVLSLLVLLTGCASAPLDPEGTLERVTGGTIRAGITDHPPWTIVDEPPAGVEVELIEELAGELGAEVEWVDGSEAELFGALELGQLDVVVGGFTSESPYAQHAALTHPYYTSRVVIAAPAGSEPVETVTGRRVAVEGNTEAVGLLEKTDAVVAIVEDVTAADGLVVADDWLLDDLGLRETGVVLSESDHVMAVRFGENGWMVTLEKFLLSRAGSIPDLLDEAES